MKSKYASAVEPRLQEIRMLAAAGKSMEEIASRLRISVPSLRQLQRLHPPLREALEAKAQTDEKVMEAFFRRACGYTSQEETTERKGKQGEDGVFREETVVTKLVKKEIPPDLGAIRWWLEKNGTPEEETKEISLEEAKEMLEEKRRMADA